ncbi:MAG TPA: c-type cytochrome [Candidatus Eremiobacteraceae bacterium]|nr:c-type cytochrome [Candidatus Eremiobacteraceae bacterium]
MERVAKSKLVILLSAIATLAFGAGTSHAQVKNPYAGDPKIAKLGESQFRSNCAFCHGLGARGGGRGPDLTRAQKRHGNSDEEIFHNVHDGIAGTAMPPATAGGIGVGMTDEEIWQVITYIRSVEKKAPADIGNRARGKELFYGSAACGTCHMVNGKGGRLGPELTTTATSRSAEYFAESVRSPSKRLAQGIMEVMKDFPQEYETANVTAADGTKYQGVVLNEDAFTLQVLDTREVLHSWEKSSLKSYEKTRQSLMPAYDEKTLPEKDLQDLLAFLAASASGGAK